MLIVFDLLVLGCLTAMSARSVSNSRHFFTQRDADLKGFGREDPSGSDPASEPTGDASYTLPA
jgi:hypothetical protein